MSAAGATTQAIDTAETKQNACESNEKVSPDTFVEQKRWEPSGSAWKDLWYFVGPGWMVCIAYIDPGNYQANIQLGATSGYRNLWTIWWMSVMSIYCQVLCVRLATYAQVTLSEAQAMHQRKWFRYFNWAVAEFSAVITDIPEVIAISPLENIKLAAQLDKEGRFKGSADIARHILKTRGFSGLMTGYAGMQVRQCLWTGGFFLTLDEYKRVCKTVIPSPLAQDVVAGFCAGATGTLINCWTDVCRSVIQKKALADTFDPSIPRPSALSPYNPGPFFGQAAELMSTKGIGGLYAGVGPKMVHLGGSGAILAVLMPRFKTMYFDAMGIQA